MIYPKFDVNGLVPAIAQDYNTNKVLMLAYMNKESFELTVKENIVHYYSRSRNKIWKKGESSGNVQNVKSIYFDCDLDALLIKIEQIGDAACHEGYNSCFFRELNNGKLEVIDKKVFDPKEVYK